MLCPKCGYEIGDNAEYCPYCGTAVKRAQQATYGTYNDYQNTAGPGMAGPNMTGQSSVYRTRPQPSIVSVADLPPELRPMSAWGYVGWGILFMLPIAGFILVIVFSCVSGNINRKKFARSYLCWWLIAAIVIAILMIAGVLTWNGLINGQYFPFRIR